MNAPRSASYPFSQTSRWIWSRIACHRSAGPLMPFLTAVTARSNATQAITLECTKCRRGPRTSQIPSSGSSQCFSRNDRSARCSDQACRSTAMPVARPSDSASMTSPYTSSWRWFTAALPIRTGAEFS